MFLGSQALSTWWKRVEELILFYVSLIGVSTKSWNRMGSFTFRYMKIIIISSSQQLNICACVVEFCAAIRYGTQENPTSIIALGEPLFIASEIKVRF